MIKKNIVVASILCLVFSGFVQAGYRMDTVAATPHVIYPVGLALPAIKASQSFTTTGSFIYGFYFYANKIGAPSNYLITILRSSLTGADIKLHNWSPLLMYSVPHWYTWAETTTVTYGATYYFIYETMSVSPANYYQVFTDNTNPYPSGQFYYSTADVPYPTDDALIAIIYYTIPNGGPCYVNADCESNNCIGSIPPAPGLCAAVSATDPSTTGVIPATTTEGVPTDFNQTITAGTNPLSCYAFEFGDASSIQPFPTTTGGVKTLSHTYAAAGTYNTMTKVCDNSGGVCTNEAVPAGCYKINSTVIVGSTPTTAPGYCNSAGDCNYGYNCNRDMHTCYPRAQFYSQWGDFFVQLFYNWNIAYVILAVAAILFIAMVAVLKRAGE